MTLLLELFMCGGKRIPVKLVDPKVELTFEELLEESLSMVILGGMFAESIWGLKIWGKSWLQLGREAWWRLTSWFIGVGREETPKLPTWLFSVVLVVSLTVAEPVLRELLFTSIALKKEDLVKGKKDIFYEL